VTTREYHPLVWYEFRMIYLNIKERVLAEHAAARAVDIHEQMGYPVHRLAQFARRGIERLHAGRLIVEKQWYEVVLVEKNGDKRAIPLGTYFAMDHLKAIECAKKTYRGTLEKLTTNTWEYAHRVVNDPAPARRKRVAAEKPTPAPRLF